MSAQTIEFRKRPDTTGAYSADVGGDVAGRRGVDRPTGTTRRQIALEKRIRRLSGMAIEHFVMIEDGDRIMVCLSGGKDSYTLLDILLKLQAVAPVRFELFAVNLDQKQPGFPEHILPDYLTALGVPFHIETQDTYSIVKRVVPEGKTTCGLCSRLRRGILYRVADELGATKIALGHHRDDILETFFLNLFHGGKLKTMPPKLVSDDGNHVVIRPLAYVPERDIEKYAAMAGFPIIPCNLCGSQPSLKRAETKAMLRQWERDFPGRVESTFRAMSQVVPTHLLDHTLNDFAAVRADGIARDHGDTAFDAMSLEPSADMAGLEDPAENDAHRDDLND
jgi:tRNA 2-thiocytidine biosynthesis protein TtcA